MRQALAASIVAMLAIAGCKPDTLELTYEWRAGEETSYRMTATATAHWDVGTEGSGSYRVQFEVLERVLSTDGHSAAVEVTMTPIAVEEHGMASPGASERTFSLRIDRRGKVLDVLEVDDVSAAQLAPHQVAFIGSYRPPLPSYPVGLRDRWTSERSSRAAPGETGFVTSGSLARLLRDEDADVAEIELTGTGPLSWATELTQGRADLDGTMTTRTAATLRVIDGGLREAVSKTTGDFVVTIDAGDEPLEGHLRLDLEIEVHRT